MDFSDALKWLKDGMKVTRNSWEPFGQYVTLRLDYVRDDPAMAAEMGEPDGRALAFEPCLILHSKDAAAVTWQPTGADLFARDWLCASSDGTITWPDGTVA